MSKKTYKTTTTQHASHCSLCGRNATATADNEGYSSCCNERICYDTCHLLVTKEEDGWWDTIAFPYREAMTDYIADELAGYTEETE